MRRRFARGRSLALRPIDAKKNIIQSQLDVTLPTLTVNTSILVKGVQDKDIDETVAANEYQVPEGASVRSINLFLRVLNRSGGLPGQEKAVIIIRRNPSGLLGNPPLATMNALNTASWKNNIFAVQQAKPDAPGGIGMIQLGIRIPKRYHRVSLNDTWEVCIGNNGAGSFDICGCAVYKYYK